MTVVTVALVTALAGCAAAPPVRVSPPTGPARDCARLQAELPETVADGERREIAPATRRVAAWGDPPVVLRCGVPRPAVLTPLAQLIEVNGVDWVLAERARWFVFTTAGRRTYVELRVPASTRRAAATAPLVDVAAAVRRAVPRTR